MYTFTVLPTLVIITFVIVTLYKHFIRKERQDLKSSFLFALFGDKQKVRTFAMCFS
jgi:uncharacterized membrane protein YesL